MKTKIKLFREGNTNDLENDVNEFIEKNAIDVISFDIKLPHLGLATTSMGSVKKSYENSTSYIGILLYNEGGNINE